MNFNKCLICIILYLMPNLVASKTTTAIMSLFWSNSLTWDNGVPSCGDTVIIPSGIIVTIGSHINLDENNGCSSPMNLQIEGTLFFNTGMKMYLPCNSYIDITGQITKGIGWGSSNIIQICQVTVWSSADSDVTGPASFGTPLPITLTGFWVSSIQEQVWIHWQTSSEINNDYFTVEKSRDLKAFEVVSQMEGAGNSREVLEYTAYDRTPWKGTSYYRLKQTDFDGRFSYSDIASLEYEGNVISDDIQVVPNPNPGIFVIELGMSFRGKVRVYDSSGRTVLNNDVDSESSIPVEMSLFDIDGVYFVELNGEDFNTTTRFVVSH